MKISNVRRGFERRLVSVTFSEGDTGRTREHERSAAAHIKSTQDNSHYPEGNTKVSERPRVGGFKAPPVSLVTL